MAMTIREYDFSSLIEKFLDTNLPSMEIVRFANKHKENCVHVLEELQEHLSVYLSMEQK